MFMYSYNDKIVANARLEGLTTDLKMTGNQYLTGLTLYFLGYVLFEVYQFRARVRMGTDATRSLVISF
jgi:hypothetical protein